MIHIVAGVVTFILATILLVVIMLRAFGTQDGVQATWIGIVYGALTVTSVLLVMKGMGPS